MLLLRSVVALRFVQSSIQNIVQRGSAGYILGFGYAAKNLFNILRNESLSHDMQAKNEIVFWLTIHA